MSHLISPMPPTSHVFGIRSFNTSAKFEIVGSAVYDRNPVVIVRVEDEWFHDGKYKLSYSQPHRRLTIGFPYAVT
jgi:hypothetical protein